MGSLPCVSGWWKLCSNPMEAPPTPAPPAWGCPFQVLSPRMGASWGDEDGPLFVSLLLGNTLLSDSFTPLQWSLSTHAAPSQPSLDRLFLCFS